jgi:antitoxin (DNA-binding transcriptional repressor) of toxin-antitoxin stability system
MIVTDTEFKENIWRYLELADNEDILITTNGKGIAKLVSVRYDKATKIHSLRGVLKDIGDVTLNSIRQERLVRYDNKGVD